MWYNHDRGGEAVRKSKAQKAAEMRVKIDEYFELRAGEGRFPTEAGLILALDLSEEEYDKLYMDAVYKRELDRAKLARTDWLENQMVTESGRATGCMNALKQEKNGGYADKTPATREQKLVIELRGVGSGAAG